MSIIYRYPTDSTWLIAGYSGTSAIWIHIVSRFASRGSVLADFPMLIASLGRTPIFTPIRVSQRDRETERGKERENREKINCAHRDIAENSAAPSPPWTLTWILISHNGFVSFSTSPRLISSESILGHRGGAEEEVGKNLTTRLIRIAHAQSYFLSRLRGSAIKPWIKFRRENRARACSRITREKISQPALSASTRIIIPPGLAYFYIPLSLAAHSY